MICRINSNNIVNLIGRIASVNEYSEGKAASFKVAIDNGKEKDATFLYAKSFSPSCYNLLRVGMLVHLTGHLSTSSYEKDGEMNYVENELIADCIDFLEAKSVVEAREAGKASEEKPAIQ